MDLKQWRPRRGVSIRGSARALPPTSAPACAARAPTTAVRGVENLVDPPPPKSFLVEASSGGRLPEPGDEMDTALTRISISILMAATGGAHRSSAGRRRDDTGGR